MLTLSTTSWGVHLFAIFRTLGAWIYTSFSFSGCLGTVNLGSVSFALLWSADDLTSFSRISVLVYHSTKAERKQKNITESEPSTRPNSKSTTSLPCSFVSLSVLTGLLNFGGAFFRSRHIHLLEIPTTWLLQDAGDAGDSTMLAKVAEAEWIVAVNDWGSLFLAIAFFLAGCFNFATVRQLRLRAREEKQRLLPLAVEKGHIVGSEGFAGDRISFLVEKQHISVEDRVEGQESRLEGS